MSAAALESGHPPGCAAPAVSTGPGDGQAQGTQQWREGERQGRGKTSLQYSKTRLLNEDKDKTHIADEEGRRAIWEK